jgi:hypothetical protein
MRRVEILCKPEKHFQAVASADRELKNNFESTKEKTNYVYDNVKKNVVFARLYRACCGCGTFYNRL